MRYTLEKFNDRTLNWEYVFSSNDVHVIYCTYREYVKRTKKAHFRIIEVLTVS